MVVNLDPKTTHEGMVTVLYGLQGSTGAFGTAHFGASGAVSFPEEQGTRQVFIARDGGAVLFAAVDHERTGGTATPQLRARTP